MWSTTCWFIKPGERRWHSWPTGTLLEPTLDTMRSSNAFHPHRSVPMSSMLLPATHSPPPSTSASVSFYSSRLNRMQTRPFYHPLDVLHLLNSCIPFFVSRFFDEMHGLHDPFNHIPCGFLFVGLQAIGGQGSNPVSQFGHLLASETESLHANARTDV